MKVKSYYTLLERWDNVWHIQYGSYSRADCVDEVQAYRDAGSKKKNLTIIKTLDNQETINDYVRSLNNA